MLAAHPCIQVDMMIRSLVAKESLLRPRVYFLVEGLGLSAVLP